MLSTQLRKILATKTFATPRKEKKVILREERVMKAEVAEVPSHLTAVDMRQIGSLSGLKSGNWKKTCDYLLVFNQRGRDYAIFVELKNTLYEDKTEGMEQLRRSLPYLKFLRSICEIQYGSESTKRNINVRYSLIGRQSNQRLDKQPVRAGNQLPSENHNGISVDMFVGERIKFSDLSKR